MADAQTDTGYLGIPGISGMGQPLPPALQPGYLPPLPNALQPTPPPGQSDILQPPGQAQPGDIIVPPQSGNSIAVEDLPPPSQPASPRPMQVATNQIGRAHV